MTAMFPASGVPAADAKNSIPDPATVNCDELWYSTSRCQPRFDPAAANAVLAELINLINKGEVTYDCNFLNQVELSVRYLIQRGLPYIAFTSGVPNIYAGSFDPPVTRYNHGMTFTIIPHQSNTGSATFNANGLGPVPILKGSGLGLLPNDLLVGSPAQITYWNGNFYLIASGVVHSDIPIVGTLPKVLTSDVLFWVRTDGNDTTGDGMFNTPDRAFRTIDGCWRKVGALYIASPIYSITIQLGNTGDFEATKLLNSYGGRVIVQGDEGPGKTAYRIISATDANPGAGNPYSSAVNSNSMLDLTFRGVTFVMRGYPEGTGVQMSGLSIGGGSCNFINCTFTVEADSTLTSAIWSRDDARVGFHGINDIFGNGNRVAYVVLCTGGHFQTLSGTPSELHTHAMAIQRYGWYVTGLARASIPGCTLANVGSVTGPRYLVEANAVIRSNGQILPGDAAGTQTSGGLYL
jgi:hypothetical protein